MIVNAYQSAAEIALSRIRDALGPRGQWPGTVTLDEDPGRARSDLAPPLTALGVLALQGVPLAGVADLLSLSHNHLRLTMLPGGLWRYYANIPPDTDDSAMCALALADADRESVALTRASLTATRLPNGLFPTWFAPGWSPVVDPVPVAHVVALLGSGQSTDEAVAWLTTVVADAREVTESAYYPDPLDTHVAISRAVARGVSGLRSALDQAQERAVERLLAPAAESAYRTAQALVVIESMRGRSAQAARTCGRDRLLAARLTDGTWPTHTLFEAGNSTGPGRYLYQSWAIVGALCVRALTLPVEDQAGAV